MTEQEKKPLENTEGYFVGKELASQSADGVSPAWKRWKVKFKPSVSSDKGFSFTAFEPLKAKNTKQVEEMKEGKQYKVLFSSEERVHEGTGQSYVSKTIIGIYTPDMSSDANKGATGGTSAQGSTMASQGQSLDLSHFEGFKQAYMAKLKKDNIQPNVVHMVGSYACSMEKYRTAPLVTKCREALAPPKPEEEPVF